MATKMGFDTGTGLKVDGVTYSFPVGGATMVVGDSTDIKLHLQELVLIVHSLINTRRLWYW